MDALTFPRVFIVDERLDGRLFFHDCAVHACAGITSLKKYICRFDTKRNWVRELVAHVIKIYMFMFHVIYVSASALML